MSGFRVTRDFLQTDPDRSARTSRIGVAAGPAARVSRCVYSTHQDRGVPLSRRWFALDEMRLIAALIQNLADPTNG